MANKNNQSRNISNFTINNSRARQVEEEVNEELNEVEQPQEEIQEEQEQILNEEIPMEEEKEDNYISSISLLDGDNKETTFFNPNEYFLIKITTKEQHDVNLADLKIFKEDEDVTKLSNLVELTLVDVSGKDFVYRCKIANPGEYTLNISTIENGLGLYSSPVSINIDIQGTLLEEATEQLTEVAEFKPHLVLLDEPVEVGQRFYFSIHTEKEVSSSAFIISSNNGSFSISKNDSDDPLIHSFFITSTDEGEGEVSVSAGEEEYPFQSFSFPVTFKKGEFLDLPNFTLSTTNINASESDLPIKVVISDLYGKAIVKSTHPKVKVSLEGNIITVNSKDVGQDLTGNITVTVDGQNEEVINFRITPKREPLRMSCDGTTIRFQEGDKTYFNVPNDKGSELFIHEVNGLTCELDETKTRVYVASDKPGTYSIALDKDGYKRAIVNVVVSAIPSIAKEARSIDSEPTLSGDYGFPILTGDEKVRFIKDEEVTSVLTSPELKSDEERFSYLLTHGTFDDKMIIHSLCDVAEKIKEGKGIISDTEGAKMYQSVFNTIRNVLNIEDAYSFKERFRLLIRIFKHYHSDSFSTVKLMRYDRGWTLGEDNLVQFRIIVTFLNKYIDKNGQDVTIAAIAPYFEARILERIKNYCEQNIRP